MDRKQVSTTRESPEPRRTNSRGQADSSTAASTHLLLRLQAQIGNQAVQRMILSRATEGRAAATRDNSSVVLDDFKIGRADLRPAYSTALRQVAHQLKLNRLASVKVHGHASKTGPEALNESLSDRRAQAAAAYLVDQGVYPGQIVEIRGFGYVKPVADNKTDKGRAQNRRVEILMESKGAREPGAREPGAKVPGAKEPRAKQKTKRVPVQWIAKVFTIRAVRMNKPITTRTTVLIREEYKSVPEDEVELGLVRKPLKSIEHLGGNSWDITRFRAAYGPRNWQYTAEQILQGAAKVGTVLSGNVLESGYTEVYDSWDKYPKKRGDLLEEFRP